MNEMKEKKVQFLVSFTVDMDNPETEDFLLYFEEFLNKLMDNRGGDIILEDNGEISVKRVGDEPVVNPNVPF